MTWFLPAPIMVAVVLCLKFITPVASVLSVLLEATVWVTSAGAIEAVHIGAVMVATALALRGDRVRTHWTHGALTNNWPGVRAHDDATGVGGFLQSRYRRA